MRIALFLLGVLVVSVSGATMQNSLCLNTSCSVALSGMCLTCLSTGCSPYSTLDNTTGIYSVMQANACATPDTILTMPTPMHFIAGGASSAASHVLVRKQPAASPAQPTSLSAPILPPACRLPQPPIIQFSNHSIILDLVIQQEPLPAHRSRLWVSLLQPIRLA